MTLSTNATTGSSSSKREDWNLAHLVTVGLVAGDFTTTPSVLPHNRICDFCASSLEPVVGKSGLKKSSMCRVFNTSWIVGANNTDYISSLFPL